MNGGYDSNTREVVEIATNTDVSMQDSQDVTCASKTTQTDLVDAGGSALLTGLRSIRSGRGRIELFGRLIAEMNPLELRFVGACVEAGARANGAGAMRQHETRCNDPVFIDQVCREAPFQSALQWAISGVQVLHSTNRRATVSYIQLIKRLFADVQRLPFTAIERCNELENIRFVLTAALHHPAFRVEQKVELQYLSNHIDIFTPSSSGYFLPSQDENERESKSNETDKPRFVISLDVLDSRDDDGREFPLRVGWSDGMESFCVLAMNDVCEMHARLLDAFPGESGVEHAPRVIPYLNRDSPTAVRRYLRALSDLPARVLVSEVVTRQFLGSRLASRDLSSPPPSLALCTPSPASTSLATCTSPSRAMNQHAQVGIEQIEQIAIRALPQFCCNCAGQHDFERCPETTMLEVIASGDYKLHFDSPICDSPRATHHDSTTRSTHDRPASCS